jgi:hypothetical protein
MSVEICKYGGTVRCEFVRNVNHQREKWNTQVVVSQYEGKKLSEIYDKKQSHIHDVIDILHRVYFDDDEGYGGYL